jgi:hypothetical protein
LKIVLGIEALTALAHARLILHRTSPADVLRRNAHAAARAARSRHGLTQSEAADSCARIAFIIRRTALRLPWRADCLVQALAGQTMLLRRGIATSIAVGTGRHADGSFQAHAWLLWGPEVILGGDVSRYEPLLQSGSTGN